MSDPKKEDGGQKPPEPPRPEEEKGQRPDDIQVISNMNTENFSVLTEHTEDQESDVSDDQEGQP